LIFLSFLSDNEESVKKMLINSCELQDSNVLINSNVNNLIINKKKNKMSAYKILYIEDYEPAAITLDFILKDMGHGATCAPTGQDAIKSFDEDSYNLVLVDVHLPDMNGYEVAEHIKKSNNYDPNKVIIIGHSADLDSIDPDRADVFDHIASKNFEPNALKENIQTWTQKL